MKSLTKTFASCSQAARQIRQISSISAPHIVSNNKWDNISQAVGNTSLIYLRGPSKETGCNIYGKAEFQNPGGSIKDRAALSIIKKAEENGLLTPGEEGLIVEGTAGNTGIGLATIGHSRGYRTVIIIPATQTQEKKDALRHLGAQLIEVPAVPFSNSNHFVKIAERLANKLRAGGKKVVYADQWNNLANQSAHIDGTGPEMYQQLDGKIDVFSCAMGTGGTLTGVGKYLRSKNKDIKIALTDPRGACLYRYYKTGELKSEGDSITEGIGQGRVTGQMEGFTPDMLYEISDIEMLPVLYNLIEHEGINVGLSSGINVAGAIQVAKDLGPGHTLVTILCDDSSRYASKMFNVAFLHGRNLPAPNWIYGQNSEADEINGMVNGFLGQ